MFVIAAIREGHRPRVSPLRWFYLSVGLYLAWVVVRCLISGAPLEAFNYVREEWLFVIVPLSVYMLRDESRVEAVDLALSAGVILITIVSLAMFFAGVQWSFRDGFETITYEFPRARGIFAHALTFGNYVAVAGVYLLARALTAPETGVGWHRRLAAAGGIAGAAATFLCNSRGPIIALFAGLFALLWIAKGRRRWFGLAVVALALIVAAGSPGIRGRFTQEVKRNLNAQWPGSRLFIWEHSALVARENLLIGTGPGKFRDTYAASLLPNVPPERHYTHAHNDLLNVAAVFAIPGLAAFVLMWVVALGTIVRARRRAGPETWARSAATAALVASLVFFVSSLTEATFVDEEVRALLMLVWGVGMAAGYKNDGGPVAASGLTT